MFSKNIKLVVIIMIVFIMSLVSIGLYADCDMAAMIAKDGHTISDLTSNGNNYDYNDPYDFFQFLKDRSNNSSAKVNDDGYGILYYKANGYFYLDPENLGHEISNHGDPNNQAWYQVDGDCSVDGDVYDTTDPYETYYCEYTYDPDWDISWKWELDTAEMTIMTPTTDAIIVMGHDRQGTGGSGNHPFRLEYNGQMFTFIQNGGIEDGSTGHPNEPNIKQILFDELNNANWFDDYASNWEGVSNDVSSWIDSEIFFHWIMKNIDDQNGCIIEGIHQALTTTVFDSIIPVDLAEVFSDPYSTRYDWVNCINFVLSDGNNLYVFKNGEDSHHTLYLQTDLEGFYSVNTFIPPADSTELDQFDFVKISRDEEPFFYHDFLNIDVKTFASGITWTSCPRLTEQGTFNNEIFEQAYWNPIDQTPGLLQLTSLGAPTINEFKRIDGKRDNLMYIEYVDNVFEDHLFYNMLFRHEGYKIEVDEGADPTVLIIDGDRLGSYTLDMPDLENFWLGYYIPYPQNIEDAFGDFFGYINRVWAEDWYYDGHKTQRGIGVSLPSNSTKGKIMEYGKMYIVQMYWDVEGFSWNGSTTVEEPTKKSAPENFNYTEKMDYEVIDVVSIPSNITEIGVYENNVCVGAVVVQDSAEQILVYSDNANRDPIPFYFVVVTGRGLSTPIKDYLVLNQMTGEFEPSVIISGRQGYSAIKFGEQEEPEDIITKPILLGNYPNPFNPITTISFSLPKEDDIELTIYNIKGQKVKTLYSGVAVEGNHTMIWEGKDSNNKAVSSGIYFYKLKTNNKELIRKMLMMK